MPSLTGCDHLQGAGEVSDTGAWNTHPGGKERGRDETYRGARASGCPASWRNGRVYPGQQRKSRKGQSEACCRLGGKQQPAEERRSSGTVPKVKERVPGTPQPACWHLGHPWHEATFLPARRISVGGTPQTQRHGTHLSSLFLQIHSPMISLISGSCTFSKLAGLMPWR